MIPKDLQKHKIKEAYVNVLSEDLKEFEKEKVVDQLAEKFNFQNATGLITFGVPETHDNVIELIFSEEDPYFKDDVLKELIEMGIIDLELIKEDLEKIVENFFEDYIESLDYETFDDNEEPYHVYVNFKD